MTATEALTAIRALCDEQRRLNRFLRWGDVYSILNRVDRDEDAS